MQGPQQASIGAQRPPSANAPSVLPPSLTPSQRPNAFPGSLSDLVVSFENVKQKGECVLHTCLPRVQALN